MTRAVQLRRSLAALVVLSAAGLSGCDGQANTLGERPPRPVDFADEIALRTTPSPVNLDDNPGADGLVVRVELYRVRGTNVELLTVKGALEFSLYEGAVGSPARGEVKAFRTWRYSGKELDPQEARTQYRAFSFQTLMVGVVSLGLGSLTERDATVRTVLARGIAGWGYTVPLGWGKPGPATSSVTVTARYVPPRGRPIAAAPVTISIRAH